MSEDSLKNWQKVAEMLDEMRSERAAMNKFNENPKDFLASNDLDIEFATGQRLSDLIGNLDEAERFATVDSIASLSKAPDIGRVAAVTPIANANAVANANTNTNGFAAADTLTTYPADLRLPVGFAETDVSRVFRDDMRLNEFRQQALIKRAIMDDDALVKSRMLEDGGEFRVSQKSFRGVLLETQAVVTGNKINVLDVRLVR